MTAGGEAVNAEGGDAAPRGEAIEERFGDNDDESAVADVVGGASNNV